MIAPGRDSACRVRDQLTFFHETVYLNDIVIKVFTGVEDKYIHSDFSGFYLRHPSVDKRYSPLAEVIHQKDNGFFIVY